MSIQVDDAYVKRSQMHECHFFVGNPSKKGLMNYEKLCYYDAETSTRHYEEKFEPCDSWSVEQYEAEYDEYIARHPLSIENLTQICALIPASTKNAKKAITLARKTEKITLNNQLFYRCFFGHLLSENASTDQQHRHARDVADVFRKFRQVLGKSAVFAGFNNEKFDSGILGRLVAGANTKKSLTHVITMHGLREIDLRRWSIAVGWGSLERVGRGLNDLGYENTLKLDGMTSTDQEALDTYNARDVDILANFTHQMNKLGITHHNMPTYVKNFYGLAFEAHGIDSVKSDAAWGDYIGIGARCEAYAFYLDNSHIFDMNSLYPSVMALLPYPRFVHTHKNGFTRVELRRLLLTSNAAQRLPHRIEELNRKAGNELITSRKFLNTYKEIFGDIFYWLKVKITAVDPDYIEIFPFGYKDENNAVRFTHSLDQIYEIDSFNIAFLAHCVYEITDIRITHTDQLIFSDTIKTLYAQRQEYKKQGIALEMLNKIILNSGFGIWGSRGDKSIRYYDNDIAKRFKSATNRILNYLGKRVKTVIMYDKRTQMQSVFRDIGGKLYATDANQNRFTKSSIPGISQTTLSHARALMYSIMRKIISMGGKILYTDTDSVFVDDAGRRAIEKMGIIGNELGQIKYEASIDKGYAMGPKMYTYTQTDGKHISKAKGIRNMHKQSETFSTNHTDKLRIAKRIVASAGGITKRNLDYETKMHINEYGTRDRRWGKMLIEMLNFTAKEMNEEIDYEVIKDFILIENE